MQVRRAGIGAWREASDLVSGADAALAALPHPGSEGTVASWRID
jgi:hypothetical protein